MVRVFRNLKENTYSIAFIIILQKLRENFLTEAKPVLKSPASPKNGNDCCRLLPTSEPASACSQVRKVKNPQVTRVSQNLNDEASSTRYSNNVPHFFLVLCWNLSLPAELQISLLLML